MPTPPKTSTSPQGKQLKAGETLLKPGQRLQSVYLIQSGCIALGLKKADQMVEIGRFMAPACLGEECVFGPTPFPFFATALRPTTLLEIPIPNLQAVINGGSRPLSALLRSFVERGRAVQGELRAIRLSQEALPCPPERTAKLFGAIYHSARILGKADGAKAEEQGSKRWCAPWAALKKFAYEIFDEPSGRIEDAITLLSQLGYAKVNGDEVHFPDFPLIEAFFDYYGNYYFKGGYQNLLKTNPKTTKVTEEFLKVAEKYPADRAGNAHLPYKPAIDAMKEALGKTFEADQLFRLEQKGLFIKRTATQDGGMLSFYKADFEQMLLNWKILREIERWNELGYVAPIEVPEEPAAEEATAPNAEKGAATAAAAEETPQVSTADALREKWMSTLTSFKPQSLDEAAAPAAAEPPAAAPAKAAAEPPKIRTEERKPGEIWCSTCMSVLTPEQKICPVCGAPVEKAA